MHTRHDSYSSASFPSRLLDHCSCCLLPPFVSPLILICSIPSLFITLFFLLLPLLLVNITDEFFVLSASQHHNFEESQEAMKQQLLQLSVLLKALDPELCDFLGKDQPDQSWNCQNRRTDVIFFNVFIFVLFRLPRQRLTLLLFPLAAHLVQERVLL